MNTTEILAAAVRRMSDVPSAERHRVAAAIAASSAHSPRTSALYGFIWHYAGLLACVEELPAELAEARKLKAKVTSEALKLIAALTGDSDVARCG